MFERDLHNMTAQTLCANEIDIGPWDGYDSEQTLFSPGSDFFFSDEE